MPYHMNHMHLVNPFHHNHQHQNLNDVNMNTVTSASAIGSGLSTGQTRLLAVAGDKDAAWLDYATSPEAGANGDYKCYAERQLHRVDIAWLLISSMRVLSMQVAFGLFEAGCTRPCHVSTVVLKNVGDMLIGAIAYWLIGYGISFGNADDGVSAGDQNDPSTWTFSSSFSRIWFADTNADNAVWLFQMSFACTSTTIVSGMIAERGTLRAYLILAFIITGIIYPVVAHWVWGGGLLAGMSGGIFTDFAGSGVVHTVGAWSGLAYCFAIGPRVGRFENVNMFAKARHSHRYGLNEKNSNNNHETDSILDNNSNASNSSSDGNIFIRFKNCLLSIFKGNSDENNKRNGGPDSISIADNKSYISNKYSIFHYTPTDQNTHDGHDCCTIAGNKCRRRLRKLRVALGLKGSEDGVSVKGMLLSKKSLELSRCMLKQRALDTAQSKRGLVYTTKSATGSIIKETVGAVSTAYTTSQSGLSVTRKSNSKDRNTNSTSNNRPGSMISDNTNIVKKNDINDNTIHQSKSETELVIDGNTNAAKDPNPESTAEQHDPEALIAQDRLKRGPVEVSELDRIIRGQPKPGRAQSVSSNVHNRAAVIWGVKSSINAGATTEKSGTLKMSGNYHVKGQEVISNSDDMQMSSAIKGVSTGTQSKKKESGEKNTSGQPMMPMTIEQQAAASKKEAEKAYIKAAKKNTTVSASGTKTSETTATMSTASTQKKDSKENTNTAAATGSTALAVISDAEIIEDERSLTYNDQYGAELNVKRMLLRAGCFMDQRSGLPSIILFEKSKASSPVNMLFGTMLLLIGWFGFNCGSTTSLLNDADQVAARVGVNTMFAAIGGGSVPYFWYVLLLDDERPTLVQSVCMGILSGLVSSCAGAHLYSRWAAFFIGAIGWCFGEFADRLLRNKFYIDDVVGGFAVHGAAGIWGTIAVGLFANPDCTFLGAEWKPIGLFYGGDISFVGWQIIGVCFIATWAFTSTYVTLYIVDNFMVEIREDVISELLGSADAPRMVALLEVLCWGQLRELKSLRDKEKNQQLQLTNGESAAASAKGSLQRSSTGTALDEDFAQKAIVERIQKSAITRMSNIPIIGKQFGLGDEAKRSKKLNKKGPADLLRLIEKSKLKFSQLNIEEQCILMRALNIRVQWCGGGMFANDKDQLTSTVKQSHAGSGGVGGGHGHQVGQDTASNDNSLGAGGHSNFEHNMGEVTMAGPASNAGHSTIQRNLSDHQSNSNYNYQNNNTIANTTNSAISQSISGGYNNMNQGGINYSDNQSKNSGMQKGPVNVYAGVVVTGNREGHNSESDMESKISLDLDRGI